MEKKASTALRVLRCAAEDLGRGLVKPCGEIVCVHAAGNFLHLSDPAPALAARRPLGAGDPLLELGDRETPLLEERVVDSLGPRELPYRQEERSGALRPAGVGRLQR